jgi:hypothetical protein
MKAMEAPLQEAQLLYKDNNDLIVQRDGDGGDTCQRTGMFYFGLFLRGDQIAEIFDKFLDAVLLLCKDGLLVRHPGTADSPSFWSDPKELSRDQQDAMIVAGGAFGVRPMLNRVLERQVKRGMFYQNMDLPLLQTFSVWIRAYRAYILWPLLLITDLGFFLTWAGIMWKGRKDPDYSDDNNHIIRLLQAWKFMPTPVSWAARKLYAKTRPPCYGFKGKENPDMPMSMNYNETNRVMATLVWYHAAEHNGNPIIAMIYRPFILRCFS